MTYKNKRNIAIASLILGAILIITGMLTTGNTVIPSWLQGAIILSGFLITTFGTKQLRCKQCHKFPDFHTGKCEKCE